MNNSELFAVLRTQLANVKEIPAPVARENAPAHEGKPYRDPYLYVNCPPENWDECARILKTDDRLSFDFLTMVTAIDYVKTTATELPRIDVVYHLFSFRYRHKLVVKVSVPRENPVVTSSVQYWKTADWQEREVFDLFGVQFKGHPNLKRIMMWEEFPGWPLRKDYVHIPDRYDD